MYVGDVAHCFAHALVDGATIGRKYPLCGPDVFTLRELVALVGRLTENERPHRRACRPRSGVLQALALELLPGKLMTRDNLASMAKDSVCDCAFPAEFGLAPAALAAVAPAYLAPAAAKSRYDAYRSQSGR